MPWLAIRAILGRALSALGKLNLWQILLIAAIIFGAIQTVRVKAEQRHSAKVEAQLIKATGELKRLSGESKVQQRTVTRTIDHYITVVKPEVRTRVQRIENAPLPGNCGTPQEVMGADV